MSPKRSAGRARPRLAPGLLLAAVGVIGAFTVGQAHAERCYSGSGAALPAPPAPVDWTCFTNPSGCVAGAVGFISSYTYQGQPIRDEEGSKDSSNGGTGIGDSTTDIGSGSPTTPGPGPYASSAFGYFDGGTAYDASAPASGADDHIFFRWRLCGDPSQGTTFKSAHWNVLFDIDGDGYKEYWLDLDGGMDKLRILYDNNNSQLVSDPDSSSIVDLPAYSDGRAGSYTRVVAAGDGTGDYYLEAQIPMLALKDSGCNQMLFPDSPVAFFYSTSNSATDPLQKDHMMDGDFITAADPITYGDVIYPNGQPVVHFIDSAGAFADIYRIGQDIHIWVNDRLANTNAGTAQSVHVTITNPSTSAPVPLSFDGDDEPALAIETAVNTGYFSTVVSSDPTPVTDVEGLLHELDASGTLFGRSGDDIIVSYTNATSGQTVNDTATVLGPCGATIQFTRANGLPSSSFELTGDPSTSDRLYVTVIYPDANSQTGFSPAVRDTVTVRLVGSNGTPSVPLDDETLVLSETGVGSGIFRNIDPVAGGSGPLATVVASSPLYAPTAGNGRWEDYDGGRVTATMAAYTCGGAPRPAVSETATLFYIDEAGRVYFTNQSGTGDVWLYSAGQPVYVKVTDQNVSSTYSYSTGTCGGAQVCDGNPLTPRTVQVLVHHGDTGDSRVLTLTETSESFYLDSRGNRVNVCSGTFTWPSSTLTTQTSDGAFSAGDDLLEVPDGATITVDYVDCADGDTSADNNTKTDTAIYNAPSIVVNEVLFNPSTAPGSCDRETVELLNTTSGAIDITGYRLADGEGDFYTVPQYCPAGVCQNITLQPGERAVVSLYVGAAPSSDVFDFAPPSGPLTYYLFAEQTVSNRLQGADGEPADQVLVYDLSGEVVDYVGWSMTTSPSLDFRSDDTPAVSLTPAIWSDDAFVNATSVVGGQAMRRSPSGRDTNTVSDWVFVDSVVCDRITTLTPVLVTGLSATRTESGVAVDWETELESGAAGYRLYREANGERRRVGAALVPALLASSNGGRYRVLDPDAPAGRLVYWLAEVGPDGRERMHGPFRVVPTSGAAIRAQATGQRPIDPALRDRLRRHADLVADQVRAGSNATDKSPAARAEIAVTEPGLYVLDAQRIASLLGLTTGQVQWRLRHGQLRLTRLGARVAWFALAPDRLVFYGDPVDSPFSGQTIYVLEPQPRSAHTLSSSKQRGSFGEPPATEYRALLHEEKDAFEVTAGTIDPSSDYWFWDYMVAGTTAATRRHTVRVDDPVGAGTASLTINARGWSSWSPNAPPARHHLRVSLNGAAIGEARWIGGDVSAELRFPATSLTDGDNTVELTALLDGGTAVSVVYLDSLDLAFDRHAVALGDRLILRPPRLAPLEIGGFGSSRLLAFDLGDPTRPRQVPVTVTAESGGGYRALINPTSLSTHLVTSTEALIAPAARSDRLGDLRSPHNGADYVILTSAELLGAAEELAAYRGARGLMTRVVDVDDVYDEFSNAMPDPEALRSFLAWANANWSRPPRFALLLGAGSIDYRDLYGLGGNLVPPLMRPTPSGLFASDSRFGDVDDDGVPEIAVGRIPALLPGDVTAYLAKLSAFEAARGEVWRNATVLAADESSDALVDFAVDSERIAGLLPDPAAAERIYLSQTPVAQARLSLFAALEAGAGLVNYIGHGAGNTISGRKLLTNDDVATLPNPSRTPVVTALSCSIGLFTPATFTSLAERLVLEPERGAVAVWAPTGLSENNPAEALGEQFALAMLPGRTLGESVQAAVAGFVAQRGRSWVTEIYTLFGDPALEAW